MPEERKAESVKRGREMETDDMCACDSEEQWSSDMIIIKSIRLQRKRDLSLSKLYGRRYLFPSAGKTKKEHDKIEDLCVLSVRYIDSTRYYQLSNI